MTKGGFVSALCSHKDSRDEMKRGMGPNIRGRSRVEYYDKLTQFDGKVSL